MTNHPLANTSHAIVVRCFVAFALLVSATGAHGQTVAQVVGRVIDATSKAPIPNARVMLMPSERPPTDTAPRMPPSAVTDTEGRFAISGVTPGRHRATAQKQGFVFEPASAPEITVTEGQTASIEIALARGGAVTGRILDERDEPLTDVQVSAVPHMSGRSNRTGVVGGGPGMITNDLGKFRLAGLAEGEYVIMAAPQPARFGRMPRTTTWAPTYYPGTTDPEQAQAIALRASDTVDGIEFRLVTAPAFRVSGIVVDTAGRPVADAMVTLQPQSSDSARAFMPPSFNRANADGTFDVGGLVAGTYSVSAVRMVQSSSSASTVVSMLNLSAKGQEQQVTIEGSDVVGLKIVIAQ
jgi:hypothetical protein